MAEKFFPYDPATALDSLDAIEVFLTDAFETSDASHIAAAFCDVARAQGMNALVEHTGLSRDQLIQSLGEDGNPSLRTTLELLKAVGLRLAVVPTSVDPPDGQAEIQDVGEDAGVNLRDA